ncbi:uncharacterized protein V1510DRAFT_407077 [Dipodascopsis tothii]|uniref:uncharacterized protein n=1 Tax=Dipodascopsis tothii TaxID=44089 RepID=UPI0034CED6CC
MRDTPPGLLCGCGDDQQHSAGIPPAGDVLVGSQSPVTAPDEQLDGREQFRGSRRVDLVVEKERGARCSCLDIARARLLTAPPDAINSAAAVRPLVSQRASRPQRDLIITRVGARLDQSQRRVAVLARVDAAGTPCGLDGGLPLVGETVVSRSRTAVSRRGRADTTPPHTGAGSVGANALEASARVPAAQEGADAHPTAQSVASPATAAYSLGDSRSTATSVSRVVELDDEAASERKRHEHSSMTRLSRAL